MRMVNRKQLLTPIAHGALSGKQVFGRGFVSDERIGGDIPQRIDGLGAGIIAADQAAAFVRRCLPRVVYHLTVMRLQECEHTSGNYLANAQTGTEVAKGKSETEFFLAALRIFAPLREIVLRGQSLTIFRCSSANCFASTSPGASIIKSCAEAVFGKAITSRMFSVGTSTIIVRSIPEAMPPCGGVP